MRVSKTVCDHCEKEFGSEEIMYTLHASTTPCIGRISNAVYNIIPNDIHLHGSCLDGWCKERAENAHIATGEIKGCSLSDAQISAAIITPVAIGVEFDDHAITARRIDSARVAAMHKYIDEEVAKK